VRPLLVGALASLGCRAPAWDEATEVEILATHGPIGGEVFALVVGADRTLAGTASGRVLASTDDGATWEALPPLPAGLGGVLDAVDAVVDPADGPWAAGPGATFRLRDGAWERVRAGTFQAPSALLTDGSAVYVASARQPVFRHDPGAEPVRLDALGPVQALAVDGATLVARLDADGCPLARSPDRGVTVTALPPAPGCPDLLAVRGDAVRAHRRYPPATWVFDGSAWEDAPPTPALRAWTPEGASITEDGAIRGADGAALPRPPGDPVAIAGDPPRVGLRGGGVVRWDGAAWVGPGAGFAGHTVRALVLVDGAPWAAVRGGVQRFAGDAWQDRSAGLPPGVRPLAATAAPWLVTEEDGPFAWTGLQWEPRADGWPRVEGAAIAGTGITTLASGLHLAATRPAPDAARVLVSDGGAWRDVTTAADLAATDGPRVVPLGGGALVASVRGWRITEDGATFQETGPGVFDRPPYPLVLDSAGDRWLALFDPFDELEPCERCAPARGDGPGFPIARDGLPVEVLVAGIAEVGGVALLTVAAPEPALWRYDADRWVRIAPLAVTPAGPLVADDDALWTDTRDGGVVRLTPR
jgi:hypothetical protein